MATDIVPELLENIQRDFNDSMSRNTKIQSIRKLIDEGAATYEQANEYAIEAGELLAKAYKKNLNSDVLPDGRMYFNIADRILNPTLNNNHVIVARISAEIQQNMNRSVGLGLMGIQPAVNQFRIDSIINRVVTEEMFDDVAWILEEPVVNFTQSVVDETIKENFNFQGEAGLRPKIKRSAHGSPPCDWCKSIQGVYDYPNVPDGVYKRHDRCRCTVEYYPGNAEEIRRQNVWSKEWSD